MKAEFSPPSMPTIGKVSLPTLIDASFDAYQAYQERLVDAEAAVSQNPVYAWKAWKVWRAAKKTPPAWVMNYFDRVTDGILDLAERSEKETLKSIGGLLLGILGLGSRSGGRSAFTAYTLFRRDVEVAAEVAAEIEKGKRSGRAVAIVATKRGLDPKTVERAWRHNRDWQALPLRKVREMIVASVKDKNP